MSVALPIPACQWLCPYQHVSGSGHTSMSVALSIPACQWLCPIPACQWLCPIPACQWLWPYQHVSGSGHTSMSVALAIPACQWLDIISHKPRLSIPDILSSIFLQSYETKPRAESLDSRLGHITLCSYGNTVPYFQQSVLFPTISLSCSDYHRTYTILIMGNLVELDMLQQTRAP